MLSLASTNAAVSCRNVGDVDNTSSANLGTRSGDRPCCPCLSALLPYQNIVIRDYEDAGRAVLPRHTLYSIRTYLLSARSPPSPPSHVQTSAIYAQAASQWRCNKIQRSSNPSRAIRRYHPTTTRAIPHTMKNKALPTMTPSLTGTPRLRSRR